MLLIAFSLLLTPVIAKFSVYTMVSASLTWSISSASYYQGGRGGGLLHGRRGGLPRGATLLRHVLQLRARDGGHRDVTCGHRDVQPVPEPLVLPEPAGGRQPRSGLLQPAGRADVCPRERAPGNIRLRLCARRQLHRERHLQLAVDALGGNLVHGAPIEGMESTLYALLAGCYNFGSTVGSNCGALLLESFGVNPSGAEAESDEFQNLWKAALVVSVLPLLTVALIFALVPAASQSESLVGASATEGSLLQQWLAPREGAAGARAP
ncbi:unnamed protein product [Prorocentrum cordatum]|uniref:Uncharacterized protein n=1 Tax=Prorocentrum cordatum TaxID=2364126 RepID=A0ABN9PS78_9DINO|nr:unnamed protein product [Polarella glacialis]